MERWVAARTSLEASFEHAKDVLMDDVQSILPDATPDGWGGSFVELRLEASVGGGVRHDVEVTLGAPCSAEGETWVPIKWVPVAHARLLPGFDGVVELVGADHDAELSITGTYRVPLGVVGRFGDGLVGRRVAQQSLRALVERMAGEIDRQVGDRLAHAAAVHPVVVPERNPPAR